MNSALRRENHSRPEGLEKSVELTSGEEIYALARALFPICRSLTGEGQRQTLRILREVIDLTVHEVPSGTRLFDWTVPREWNIRGAYIADRNGRKIVDFADSNLHVLGYSVPVERRMNLAALKPHLFSLPEHPDWIPYRTSYYQENWGFCLRHRTLLEMTDGEYEVRIDSSLQDGTLCYGEFAIPGKRAEEVLISCHICHPSLANDNLSGIAVAALLAKELAAKPRRYSYRFLFTPGQIGSIAWLCRNEGRAPLIKAGLILACLGDSGAFTYKKSRRGDSLIDRAVARALSDRGAPFQTMEFSPFGYDERQFCSPGFNLPVGCFMRTPHGCFPEYHTSADNLEFISAGNLAESFDCCRAIIDVLEEERTLVNLLPKCEPQLGKRGLYGSIGGASGAREREMGLLWVLNLSDGRHSLLDIAQRSGLSFRQIAEAAAALEERGLVQERKPEGKRPRVKGKIENHG